MLGSWSPKSGPVKILKIILKCKIIRTIVGHSFTCFLINFIKKKIGVVTQKYVDEANDSTLTEDLDQVIEDYLPELVEVYRLCI